MKVKITSGYFNEDLKNKSFEVISHVENTYIVKLENGQPMLLFKGECEEVN